MVVVTVLMVLVSTGDWFQAVITLLGKQFAVAVCAVRFVIL